jgi:hypothetical protein
MSSLSLCGTSAEKQNFKISTIKAKGSEHITAKITADKKQPNK